MNRRAVAYSYLEGVDSIAIPKMRCTATRARGMLHQRGCQHLKMSPYSATYQRVVVLLLMAAYTFNSMDRSIISILGPSIKADLKLTDTQLGLLGGTAFAMLYALGGLPIARLAERVSRVNIMAVALIAWSSLTALCAAAGSFGQLLLIRVGVGVAEAGCSPPAHSLISDYVEPSRRASALSVYSCGISLGYILAAAVGGYLAQHAGWRVACAAVGLPGIVTALLIKAVVREPPRGGSDPVSTQAALAPFSMRHELAELKAVGAALLLDAPVLHMVLGVTVGAFAAYGFYYFIPAYFRREFELGPTVLAFSPGEGSRTFSRARARAGMPWCPPSAERSPCLFLRSPFSRAIGRARPRSYPWPDFSGTSRSAPPSGWFRTSSACAAAQPPRRSSTSA